MKSFCKLGLILAFGISASGHLLDKPGFILANKPEGSGVPESSKAAACEECNKHSDYLAECFCHATDIAGTFANDATKESTSRDKMGSKTENTGVKRLPPQWTWHCRPVSGSGVWEAC